MNTQFDVLLVEDDDNDVLLLKRAFREANIQHPLRVCRDGHEATEYLAGVGDFGDRGKYPLPCLILLDLKMPRKTGMEVLKWLRDQPALRCIPVIVFSSSAHRYDVERAYIFGANAFVVKPANNEKRLEFAVLVKSFWLMFNEPPLICTEGRDAAQAIHSEVSLPPVPV